MIEAVIFYILAAVLIGMGLLVITRTNPIAAALAMVVAFAALAGLYAMLSAGFLAVLQVLVYAGGIMVLMVFVIMLLNLNQEDLAPMKANLPVIGLALLGTLVMALAPLGLVAPRGPMTSSLPEGFGNLAFLGEKLFLEHVFPFEMLSLLLLTAVVGALVLSKKKL